MFYLKRLFKTVYNFQTSFEIFDVYELQIGKFDYIPKIPFILSKPKHQNEDIGP
jgi:hypothetical protein